jgi:endonuclease/exonuclease/phosphatase (EEP) superfamily protein YafD
VTLRARVRLGLPLAALLVVGAAKAADWHSRHSPDERSRFRLVTANASAEPQAVAAALRALSPDIVALQETAISCAAAAESLRLEFLDGSDQCLLAAWPLKPSVVEWPGPWQPPQVVRLEAPQPLTLVNVRLAMPAVLVALTTLGDPWYSEEDRQAQFAALRAAASRDQPVLVCGDFNAFPGEVDLGDSLSDVWQRRALGASFPSWLPVVRIDQCWSSRDVVVHRVWTAPIPSDHRALVVDFELAGNGTLPAQPTT